MAEATDTLGVLEVGEGDIGPPLEALEVLDDSGRAQTGDSLLDGFGWGGAGPLVGVVAAAGGVVGRLR